MVPSPSDDKCDAYAKVFVQIPMALAAMAAWVMDPSGAPSDEFKGWIGTLGTGAPDEIVPKNVSASKTHPDDVTVQWSSVPAAVSYEVWRGTTMVATELSLIASGVTGTTYEDKVGTPNGAVENQTYFYAVRAVTRDTTSAFSQLAEGYTLPEETGGGGTPGDLVGPPVIHDSIQPRDVVVPVGASKMDVELWAPGGSGGNGGSGSWVAPAPGCPAPYGGGGASGGLIKFVGIDVISGNVYTITAGQGGKSTEIVLKTDNTKFANLGVDPVQHGKNGWYNNALPPGECRLINGDPGAVGSNTSYSGGFGTGTFTAGNPGVLTEGGAAVANAKGQSGGRGGNGTNTANGQSGANGKVVISFFV